MSNEYDPIEIIKVDGNNPNEFIGKLHYVLNNYKNVRLIIQCPNDYNNKIDSLSVYKDKDENDSEGHVVEIGYRGLEHLNDVSYCCNCGFGYTGRQCPKCKFTQFTKEPNSKTKREEWLNGKVRT